MSYPDSLLHRGERVVIRKHPSGKTLVLPIVWLLVIIGGGSALIAWSRSWTDSGFTSHQQWLIAIIVVGVILLVVLCLVPFLRWRTEHFVLSTGHIFFRSGLLRRREHQIPLSRIQNIETVVTFWGRLLGYGSLIVESAAEQPLEFQNVASISKVQSTLNQLIADDRSSGGDYGGEGDKPERGGRPAAGHDEQRSGRDVTARQTRSYPAERGAARDQPARTEQYPDTESGYQQYPGPPAGYAPPPTYNNPTGQAPEYPPSSYPNPHSGPQPYQPPRAQSVPQGYPPPSYPNARSAPPPYQPPVDSGVPTPPTGYHVPPAAEDPSGGGPESRP